MVNSRSTVGIEEEMEVRDVNTKAVVVVATDSQTLRKKTARVRTLEVYQRFCDSPVCYDFDVVADRDRDREIMGVLMNIGPEATWQEAIQAGVLHRMDMTRGQA